MSIFFLLFCRRLRNVNTVYWLCSSWRVVVKEIKEMLIDCLLSNSMLSLSLATTSVMWYEGERRAGRLEDIVENLENTISPHKSLLWLECPYDVVSVTKHDPFHDVTSFSCPTLWDYGLMWLWRDCDVIICLTRIRCTYFTSCSATWTCVCVVPDDRH